MDQNMETIKFTFRNTKHNGEIAGTVQAYEIPKWEWEEVKQLPITELFVQRCYLALAKKLVRERLQGNLNGTSAQHFQSLETMIIRSISYTKKEIEDWFDSQIWESNLISQPERAIPLLRKWLPEYANRDDVIPNEKLRVQAAKIFADVADTKSDPIAEYLWGKLTQPIIEDDPLQWL